MKHINAFAKLSDVRNNFILSISLGSSGLFIYLIMIINPPLKVMRDNSLEALTSFNVMKFLVVLGLSTFCFICLCLVRLDGKNTKKILKANKMKDFLEAYKEVVSFNKTIYIDFMWFTIAVLFYAFILILCMDLFLSTISSFIISLSSKIVGFIGVIIIGASLFLSLSFYVQTLKSLIKTTKEFKETLNEKSFSIGLHKGMELVSAHSMYELLEYIKDGYSYDENFVKQILFD